MDSDKYGVSSPFDMDLHQANFVNYLEVIVSPEGFVEYACPSHQEALIRKVCEKYGLTREELVKAVPQEWYMDFSEYLARLSGYIAVWTEGFVVGRANDKQISVLDEFRDRGMMHDYQEHYNKKLEDEDYRAKFGLLPEPYLNL